MHENQFLHFGLEAILRSHFEAFFPNFGGQFTRAYTVTAVFIFSKLFTRLQLPCFPLAASQDTSSSWLRSPPSTSTMVVAMSRRP